MANKPTKTPPTAPYDVPNPGRTTVSDQQIAQAAYDAGFRGNALATAVAVALAESHGNATALNDRGEFSVGMWQINVNGYLASRLKKWGFGSWMDLWNPENNAKAAYDVSNGGKNFGLWSTYKHGTYLKYMTRATTAAKGVDPNGTYSGPTGVLTGYTGSSTDPANQAGAQAFLNWWNSNQLSHNALSSWDGILNEYSASTGDSKTADYIRGLFGKFGVDPTVAVGPFGFQSNEPGGLLITYLNTVAGTDAGIFQPVIDFVNGFVGGIEHGFYFLVIVIIGLVVLFVGIKARPASKGDS
jgi:hypothetical protein